MRNMMYGAALLAVGFVLYQGPVSSYVAKSKDAQAATFAERFAPVLKPASG